MHVAAVLSIRNRVLPQSLIRHNAALASMGTTPNRKATFGSYFKLMHIALVTETYPP